MICSALPTCQRPFPADICLYFTVQQYGKHTTHKMEEMYLIKKIFISSFLTCDLLAIFKVPLWEET